ncbi:hypothetical protein ACMFMG_009280 [Clarireedia jacksonii]
MLSLSSVRRLFGFKAASDPGNKVENSIFRPPEPGDVLEGRAVSSREEPQAQKMEETVPKQLVPMESMQGAPPMIDDRKKGPSSLPEVSNSFTNHSPRASRTLTATDSSQVNGEVQTRKKRHRLRWVTFIVLGIIAIAIALGVGLGVGLQKHNGSAMVLDRGAMNGSGVVAIDLDNTTKITAYTQRYDGVIVRSEYESAVWSAVTNVGELDTALGNFNGETLVARNGTPLMALSYEYANELLVSPSNLSSYLPCLELRSIAAHKFPLHFLYFETDVCSSYS